jgi:hypothetical protein
MRGLALLLLAAALAACGTLSGSLTALSATGDDVAFAYTGDRSADALRQASLYCANLGRSAQLRELHRDGGDRTTATYECR